MADSFLFECRSLPGWLPDETLYSLVCRYHRLSCNPTAAHTAIQLFGGARRGYQHDFPCSLGELACRAGHEIEWAEKVIREHTLLPFYLPLRSASDATNALANLTASGGINGLKYRLGILTSRFRANHPLKACPICMEHDLKRYNIAYWHLSHQYPGVWICSIHRALLHESAIKANGVQRFQWCLPDQAQLFSSFSADRCGVLACDTQEKLMRLASASIELSRLPPGFHFDPIQLLATYRAALEERGLITNNGSLRLAVAGEQYASAIAPLRTLRELSALPANGAEAATQIGRMLRRPRTGTHPLRHLTLIQWLFETWDVFQKAYSKAGQANRNNPHPSRKKQSAISLPPMSSGTDKAAELLRLVIDGHSTTSAAKTIGIDVTTAIEWLAREGITTPRRPKTVKQETRNAIAGDLRKGHDKQSVSNKYQVPVQTVTRILRSEVGLQQQWDDARYLKARDAARTKWSRIMKKFPEAGAKALRCALPKEYAWLYRNDRAWLSEQILQMPPAKRLPSKPVQWDQRDRHLASEVERVSLALRGTDDSAGIPLWKICQQLPELKAKLTVLGKLPLTSRAVALAVRKGRKSQSKSLF